MSLSRTSLNYQENHYDPWGVNLVGIERSGVPDHKYQYNGKEKQEALGWYDYGARMYDAVVGRWFVVDPLASALPFASLYAYCLNNPINMVAPDGAYPIQIHVRSFAPFNYFGGGLWKGDGANRGFSTVYSGNTSRIRQITSYETTTRMFNKVCQKFILG